MTTTEKIGTRVRRTQGRASDIGRSGIVTKVYADVVGSAGDVGLEVTEADGVSFFCYSRQVEAL